MKFGETAEETRRKREETCKIWFMIGYIGIKKFAWLPVQINTGRFVWLEPYARRICSYYMPRRGDSYYYTKTSHSTFANIWENISIEDHNNSSRSYKDADNRHWKKF